MPDTPTVNAKKLQQELPDMIGSDRSHKSGEGIMLRVNHWIIAETFLVKIQRGTSGLSVETLEVLL